MIEFIELGAVLCVGCFLFVAYTKWKNNSARQLGLTPVAVNEDGALQASSDIKELESIIEAFLPRCVSYNAYNIITERNLSNQVRKLVFKDMEIEYGSPNISLPAKYFTDPCLDVVANWLGARGTNLEAGDSLTIVLSKFLVAQAKPLAEKCVADAILAAST